MPERHRDLGGVGHRERWLDAHRDAEFRAPGRELRGLDAAVLDPGRCRGERGAVPAPDHRVGVEDGGDGQVADRVGGDPPAPGGEGLGAPCERGGVGEEDPGAGLVGIVVAQRAGARHQPAVGVELDPVQADPRSRVGSAGVELGIAGLLRQAAGRTRTANPRPAPGPNRLCHPLTGTNRGCQSANSVEPAFSPGPTAVPPGELTYHPLAPHISRKSVVIMALADDK